VLVFTRKLNESIVIGDGIEVTVLRVGRDSVRLGVKAARQLPVHRGEIYQAIRQANAAAAADSGTLAALVTKLRDETSTD
jgi:carbon storage regulator